MKTYTEKELSLILKQHEMWLINRSSGKRADLSDANLSGANLSDTNLRYANLSNADLRYADLSGANLSDANLRYADLRYANLSNADLRYADLSGANLSDANLRYADLSGANLSDANLKYANLSDADLRYANLRYADLRYADLSNIKVNECTSHYALQCPETGSFDAWKKCTSNVLVKLRIPSSAKRSSGTSRKCRCSKAKVLEVIGADVGISNYNSNFTYKKGETVEVKDFDKNRWNECSSGIHFFLTKAEAESY